MTFKNTPTIHKMLVRLIPPLFPEENCINLINCFCFISNYCSTSKPVVTRVSAIREEGGKMWHVNGIERSSEFRSVNQGYTLQHGSYQNTMLSQINLEKNKVYSTMLFKLIKKQKSPIMCKLNYRINVAFATYV